MFVSYKVLVSWLASNLSQVHRHRCALVQTSNLSMPQDLIRNNNVIMTTMAPHITSLAVVYSSVYTCADQRNIKAPRHWPLWGEFTGTGEFPAQRANNAENVSIWWRHHVMNNKGDCAIQCIRPNRFLNSNLVKSLLLMTSVSMSKRFEILHTALQCRALCKISKLFNRTEQSRTVWSTKHYTKCKWNQYVMLISGV